MPGTETSSGVCQYPLLKTIKQDVNEVPSNKEAMEKIPLMSFADVQNLYQDGPMSSNILDLNEHARRKHDGTSAECSQQRSLQESLFPGGNADSNEFGHGNSVKKNQLSSRDEKPYSCPNCVKKFARSDGLRKHMLTHTGEKPYSCAQCFKRFTRTDHLKKHMMIHTGEKPHSCPQCFKRFARADHMKKHLMTHSNAKSYAVAQRSVTSAHPDHMNKHLLTHGGSLPPSQS